jgi:hypothetical protein
MLDAPKWRLLCHQVEQLLTELEIPLQHQAESTPTANGRV